MVHTVIDIGYSNVSTSRLRSVLSRHIDQNLLLVKPAPLVHGEPRPYELGKCEAQEMAVAAYAKYHAPMCVGIVCVLFESKNPKFIHSKLDIAMIVDHGVLQKQEIELNPLSCKRGALGILLDETVFAREATERLLEYIRVRHRALLLQHF